MAPKSAEVSGTTPPAAQAATPNRQAANSLDPNAEGDPVRVTKPGTFEIHVQGADLRGVLQLLSTQGKKNIVATRDVAGTVTADLYGVSFKDALDAVLRSTGFVYLEKDGFIYVYTPKQKEEAERAAQKVSTRTFHLSYINAKDTKDLIAPVLSKEALVSTTPDAGTGIGPSNTDTGGNSTASGDVLIVTDYEDNLKQVEQILNRLDVRPEQVLLEATILSAELTEDNALGVNLTTLCGVDFETLGSTSDPIGTITNTGLSTANMSKAPVSNFRTDFPTVPGGMKFGIVTNNVSAFVSALESVVDTTVLANPKLLIVNKQRGEVLVGDELGYLTTTTTEGQVTQSVAFLQTGTRLIVRPYIAKDGYLRLEIHPEDSTGSVTEVSGNTIPSKKSTELTTNIFVRDGHTIVLGGLFREQTDNNRSQIPMLGNLPVIGAAFRRTADKTRRKELIILLTPHIIRQAADEATSEQLKDDVNRYRIGQRKGVQWWGRDRLAQTHLGWARQALNEGQEDKALWNVDMALSLEPRFTEAIALKEQITGKAFWSDYYQDSTAAYIVQRMMMQEMGLPVQRIIPPDKPLHARDVAPEVREAFDIEPRPMDPIMPPAASSGADRKVKMHMPPAPAEAPVPAPNAVSTQALTTQPAKE
ncbi:MAG: secretin N-terminal domain-containing protein [Phycisphaerae bacterium]